MAIPHGHPGNLDFADGWMDECYAQKYENVRDCLHLVVVLLVLILDIYDFKIVFLSFRVRSEIFEKKI